MKALNIFLFPLAMCLLAQGSLHAQNAKSPAKNKKQTKVVATTTPATPQEGEYFEGTITYNIAMELPESMVKEADAATLEQIKKAMPSKMTMTLDKTGQARMTMNGAGAMEMLVTQDTMYTGVMGMVMVVPLGKDAEKYAQEKSADLKVEKTETMRQLAGFPSRLYKLSQKAEDQEVTSELWIVEKFKVVPPRYDPQGMFSKGISGIPALMKANASGINMTMEATEIRPHKVNASDLQQPAGTRRVMDMEELMKMQGKN